VNVIPFFEYLTEHDASHELGLALAAVYTKRTSARRAERELVGAAPNAA
jgi:hypothetical protein